MRALKRVALAMAIAIGAGVAGGLLMSYAPYVFVSILLVVVIAQGGYMVYDMYLQQEIEKDKE
jgi:hypothetical protein